MLILPGNPLFDLTLATTPPPTMAEHAATKGEGCAVAMVADSQSGIFRPASYQELEEYMLGGEYDERLNNLGSSGFEEELEMYE